MYDYKRAILERAMQEAEDRYGKDFYDLPDDLQDKVYGEAIEAELIDAKAKCPDYKHSSQPFTFAEWLKRLAQASRDMGIFDEGARAAYYEAQPATWVDWYDDGYTAHDAVVEDMHSHGKRTKRESSM